MRRILLLNTDLEIGGTPTVVRELAIRLSRLPQVEVEVACLAPWGPMADQIAAAGVKVTPLNADDVYDLPVVVTRLTRLVRQGRFDTVLSFLIHANAVAAGASRFLEGVRWFQSIQTTQPRPRWHWWMQRAVHAAAEAVIVPSPSVAEAAEEWAGVPREKIVVIPNAVDAQAFAAARQGREGRSVREVAFIGRLDPVKRIGDLLRAMRRFDGELRLSIYGDGDLRHALRDEIDQLGLRGVVQMRGTVPAVEALAATDVLVLPSEAEGLPMVLIEAMAAGIPIVATDAPGIRDVVRHEHNGLLVPVGQPDALAMAIARMAVEDALRQRLVEQGLREVREHYAWEPVLAEYRRVLGIRSGARLSSDEVNHANTSSWDRQPADSLERATR